MDIIQDNILGKPTEFNITFRNVIEAGLKKKALYKSIVKA
jgi:hypothetical protein